jgi:hypothetical protein
VRQLVSGYLIILATNNLPAFEVWVLEADKGVDHLDTKLMITNGVTCCGRSEISVMINRCMVTPSEYQYHHLLR